MSRTGPVRIRSGEGREDGEMAGGDGGHPRRQFKDRLDDLFEIAGLTNDRVATLANALARSKRIIGVTRDDYERHRPVDAKRLSDWRHSSKPAVPQRWVQLAAVLTVLIDRARGRSPGRDELYNVAEWRRLHNDALKSSRPADNTEPPLPEANSVVLTRNPDQVAGYPERVVDGCGATRPPAIV